MQIQHIFRSFLGCQQEEPALLSSQQQLISSAWDLDMDVYLGTRLALCHPQNPNQETCLAVD